MVQVKLVSVSITNLLCDGQRHYAYKDGNMTKCPPVGLCDGTSCTEGTVEEVHADNSKIPQEHLVRLGLRQITPKDTVYVKTLEDGTIHQLTSWSINLEVARTWLKLEKGEHVDLPYRGQMHCVTNPYGSYATIIPLDKIREIETRISHELNISEETVRRAYCEGVAIKQLTPTIRWALSAKRTLRENGLYQDPTFGEFLKELYLSTDKRRELLGLPDWPEGFLDWDFTPARRLLGKLMEGEFVPA